MTEQVGADIAGAIERQREAVQGVNEAAKRIQPSIVHLGTAWGRFARQVDLEAQAAEPRGGPIDDR